MRDAVGLAMRMHERKPRPRQQAGVRKHDRHCDNRGKRAKEQKLTQGVRATPSSSGCCVRSKRCCAARLSCRMKSAYGNAQTLISTGTAFVHVEHLTFLCGCRGADAPRLGDPE